MEGFNMNLRRKLALFVAFALLAPYAVASTTTWAAIKSGSVDIDHSSTSSLVIHSVWKGEELDNGMLPLVYHKTWLDNSTLASLLQDLSLHGVEPLYNDTSKGKMLVEFKGAVSFESDDEQFLLAYVKASSEDEFEIWQGSLGWEDEPAWPFDSSDFLSQESEVVWVASFEFIPYQPQITEPSIFGWQELP